MHWSRHPRTQSPSIIHNAHPDRNRSISALSRPPLFGSLRQRLCSLPKAGRRRNGPIRVPRALFRFIVARQNLRRYLRYKRTIVGHMRVVCQNRLPLLTPDSHFVTVIDVKKCHSGERAVVNLTVLQVGVVVVAVVS